MISIFSKVNKFILSFPLFFIVLLSCNDNKEEFNQNKKNDLSDIKIKGPIKHIKEEQFSGKMIMGRFIKDYLSNKTKNTYFNDEGFLLRSISFSKYIIPGDHLFRYEYDDSNRIIKTTTSFDLDKIKSANYENDPKGTVWCRNPSIDTFIYLEKTKYSYKIINQIPNQFPSSIEQYNNDEKILEKTDYSDNGNPFERIIYSYDSDGELISEFKYNYNSIVSKTNYEYYPDRKITTIIDSNYLIEKPFVKTEYFDSTKINTIKEITDALGDKDYPIYSEIFNEFDSLGNVTKTEYKPHNSDRVIAFGSIEKYVYSDFDKYGNWKIKQTFEYNAQMDVFEQTGIIERIIEPNLELISQKGNESLKSGWLYFFTAVLSNIYIIIASLIFSVLTILLSALVGSSKLHTKLLVVISAAISIIFYCLIASVFFLRFTIFEFERFGKDWFLYQIPTIILIIATISLCMSFNKSIKEIIKSASYNSQSLKVRFQYYVDYSRVVIGKMSYVLLIYPIFLILDFSVNNAYFNFIRDFIMNHF